MKREEHEKHSIELFGKPFTEIHLWLDEFAGTPKYGMKHRRVRHHQAGIEEAVKLFGEQVRQAVYRHIADDLNEEGWQEGNDPFPRNKKDYIRMGFY